MLRVFAKIRKTKNVVIDPVYTNKAEIRKKDFDNYRKAFILDQCACTMLSTVPPPHNRQQEWASDNMAMLS